MTRAERRRRRERAVLRVERFMLSWWSSARWTPEEIHAYALRHTKAKKWCRKVCCCNTRKFDGPPFVEVRRYPLNDI